MIQIFGVQMRCLSCPYDFMIFTFIIFYKHLTGILRIFMNWLVLGELPVIQRYEYKVHVLQINSGNCLK